mgnify:FL=1
MKIILILMVSFMFSTAYIVAIETDYGDSIRVVEYYMNGNIKVEGLKVKKFKHGKWKYYDDKGYLLKTERYNHGKIIKNGKFGSLK